MTGIRTMLTFLVAITLTGCLRVPQPTRAEWLEMTSHTFKNVTVEDVLKSGDILLRLDDPDDVTVYHQPEKMVGTRKYMLYAVIAADIGAYNFELSAKQNGSDVVAQLLIGQSSQPITPTVTYTPGAAGSGLGFGAGAGLSGGSMVPWRESYDLFYSRMEALLHDGEWVPCDQAKRGKPDGSVAALCLNADDNVPPGARISESYKRMKEEETIRLAQEKEAKRMLRQ